MAQQTIFPVLLYRDGATAKRWLGEAFGFASRFEVPGPNGGIVHAEMTLGNGMIMFGAGRTPDPDNPWCDAELGVYVCVDDVDAHYARAVKAGAEIVRELEDTDYGAREYSVRDLDGHLWSFGSYQPWKED